MIKFLTLLVVSLVVSCTQKEPENPSLHPALQITLADADVNTATVKVDMVNATGCSVLCCSPDEAAPTADKIVKKGVGAVDGKAVLTGLQSRTLYTAYAVAYDAKGHNSEVASLDFRTAKGADELYSWEEARGDRLLSYDNLALCYGGSKHRDPVNWDAERFRPHVLYTDASGKEHWLFDAFLAIEFVMTQYNMSLNLGQQRPSGDKKSWQALIDYWFDPENGFAALDKVIGEGITRIGEPSTRRKVVMVIPDAVPYQQYADATSSTTYWGTLDGEKMNFAIAEHRLRAMQWYVDEVRARWDKACYKNIDLAGFYIVSEDLAVPGYGWSAELKHWEDIYPEFSKYLHSCNESLTWIPYFAAGGYQLWQKFDIDYPFMQPNYFWHPEKSLSEFKKMVTEYNMSMEFEMDNELFEGQPDYSSYRTRFYQYMDLCKELGFYHNRPLAYYFGTNDYYNLSKSGSSVDKELFHDFSEFILGNIQH